jgi:hypothetical protein
LNVAIFNEVHLRLKHERVAWSVLLVYYVRLSSCPIMISGFWQLLTQSSVSLQSRIHLRQRC